MIFFWQETTQHVSFVSLKQKKTHVNVNKYIIYYIYIVHYFYWDFVVPRSWPFFEVDKIGIRFDTNRSSRSFQGTKNGSKIHDVPFSHTTFVCQH